jgi:hypothetical protein
MNNFHTTIAFIAWNFDRSESDVVTRFRKHPERFSIRLHGNDHAHREFGDYATVSLLSRLRTSNQGVARMETIPRPDRDSLRLIHGFPPWRNVHGVSAWRPLVSLARGQEAGRRENHRTRIAKADCLVAARSRDEFLAER